MLDMDGTITGLSDPCLGQTSDEVVEYLRRSVGQALSEGIAATMKNKPEGKALNYQDLRHPNNAPLPERNRLGDSSPEGSHSVLRRRQIHLFEIACCLLSRSFHMDSLPSVFLLQTRRCFSLGGCYVMLMKQNG